MAMYWAPLCPLVHLSTPAIAVTTRCLQVWPDSPQLPLLSPSISLSAPGLLSWTSSHGLSVGTCTMILTHVSTWKCQLESAKQLTSNWKLLTNEGQEPVNKYSFFLPWLDNYEAHSAVLQSISSRMETRTPKQWPSGSFILGLAFLVSLFYPS